MRNLHGRFKNGCKGWGRRRDRGGTTAWLRQAGGSPAVLDYKPGIILPRRIRRKACPLPRATKKDRCLRRRTAPANPSWIVLLMPLADMNITFKEAADLMALMSGCAGAPGAPSWTIEMSNCARYQGKAVALDFGKRPINAHNAGRTL